jgi:hypothetical protein
LCVQSISFDGISTELYKYDLDKDSHNEDDEEPFVIWSPLLVEEVLEHVDFTLSNLSGVDQVEDLHENKHLEDKCVVKHLLCMLELCCLIGCNNSRNL